MSEKKRIDWSCKHDVLIQNADGSYSPMDEPFYESEQVVPHVWKILSSGDFSYLVEGEQEAIAIDTGYGAGNIREYLQTLTEKPVKNVINTHHHFDHTANNGYFEKAFMGEKAIELATIPFKSFEGISFITDYERVPVKEGFTYELGGKSLEIFEIPDHTMDGIAILDRADRVLFTGDEFMVFGKNLNYVSLTTFHEYLVKLKAHRSEFDFVCGGGGVFPASFFDRFYKATELILEGNKGTPVALKPPMMPPLPAGPNGEIVYDRMRPHPGDGGAGKAKNPDREMYCFEYDGIRISYDINHV